MSDKTIICMALRNAAIMCAAKAAKITVDTRITSETSPFWAQAVSEGATHKINELRREHGVLNAASRKNAGMKPIDEKMMQKLWDIDVDHEIDKIDGSFCAGSNAAA